MVSMLRVKLSGKDLSRYLNKIELEYGPMPNVMAACRT